MSVAPSGSGRSLSIRDDLIRGILAAFRQKFHLSTCPNMADRLSRLRTGF
jgi:hypothetical protein